MSSLLDIKEKVLLTPDEMGLLIGVSGRTARRIIEDDHIPTIMLSRQRGLRVPRSAVEAWVARKQAEFDAKLREYEADARALAKIVPARRHG